MNKSLTMRYYHALRQTNLLLAKSSDGISMIMKEAFWMAKMWPKAFFIGNIPYFVDWGY